MCSLILKQQCPLAAGVKASNPVALRVSTDFKTNWDKCTDQHNYHHHHHHSHIPAFLHTPCQPRQPIHRHTSTTHDNPINERDNIMCKCCVFCKKTMHVMYAFKGMTTSFVQQAKQIKQIKLSILFENALWSLKCQVGSMNPPLLRPTQHQVLQPAWRIPAVYL